MQRIVFSTASRIKLKHVRHLSFMKTAAKTPQRKDLKGEAEFEALMKAFGNQEKTAKGFWSREAKIYIVVITSIIASVAAIKLLYKEKLPAIVQKLLREAEEWEDKGNYAEASKFVLQALNVLLVQEQMKLNPFTCESVLRIYYYLSLLYFDSQQILKAIDTYTSALKFISRQPQTDVNIKWKSIFNERIANCFFDQGSLEDAERYLNRSVRALISKKNLEIFQKLAIQKKHLDISGLTTEEVTVCSDVRKFSKELSTALNSLAMLCWSDGREQGAANLLTVVSAVLELSEVEDKDEKLATIEEHQREIKLFLDEDEDKPNQS